MLAEVGPGGAGALVAALDVDLHDQVPVQVLHVLEADVAQDAGVVDEDVDAAESLDGRVDDLVSVLDAVVVGDRLATGSLDLVDYNIGGLEGVRNGTVGICQECQHNTYLAVAALALE